MIASAGTILPLMGKDAAVIVTAALQANRTEVCKRIATLLQQPPGQVALPAGVIVTIGDVVVHSLCKHLRSQEGALMVKRLVQQLVRPTWKTLVKAGQCAPTMKHRPCTCTRLGNIVAQQYIVGNCIMRFRLCTYKLLWVSNLTSH